ncbi:hypothetical protein [Hydrogenophaga sp. ZJX-1]|uniref:hypothetical protein n=1 Tax=Hydrogenophaga sp. ZJX-1 TaxID=3404778 RepID=UPI003B281C16
MPNVKRTRIHAVRTRLWAALVADQLRFNGSKEIERFICSSIDLDLHEPSGVFRGYISGRTMPSRTVGPVVEGVWLDRVDCVLPGTSDWFRSPVWFLLDDHLPTNKEIMDCIRLLPEALQVELLISGTQHLPEQYQFRVPSENRVLVITHHEASWRLGALACVYRLADLNGNKLVARRALLTLVQAIEDICARSTDSRFRNVFLEFRELVREHVSKYLWALGGSDMQVDLSEHIQEQKDFELFDMRMEISVRRWLRNIL